MIVRGDRLSVVPNPGQTLASGDVDANGDVVSALTDRLRKAIGDTAWPVDPCEHLELVRKLVWQARR